MTLLALTSSVYAIDKNTVEVTYDGDKAVVNIADNISGYVSASIDRAYVKLIQAETVADNAPGEIYYILSGSTTDGSFYLSGSYKASVTLNGLTLTNPQGPAIDIQNGKRINLRIENETTNSLTDGAGGDWKGCFVCKGHTEFKGKGTLTVNGKTAHGIWSKEYVEIKNCAINVKGAKNDGIHCQQYFKMTSGAVSISDVDDDGIRVELKGETATAGSDTEDEDTGNFYMAGGSLTISNVGNKCIKTDGTIAYTGGTQNFTLTNVEENAKTTAIQTVRLSADDTEAVFDLNGRQLPKDALCKKGVYIIRSQQSTRKVIIR